jgi:hypothetical protein
MQRQNANAKWFALPAPPPQRLDIAGQAYTLLEVFKHDFYAATALYQPVAATLPRAVVKFYRLQGFCGLPMGWVGRRSREREKLAYRLLAGVEGIPRYLGDVGANGCAIEYVPAQPLDHCPSVPAEFWPRLRELFDAVHARGLAYIDANKRSNILVDQAGRPYLVDFQISLPRRDDLPWPLRSLRALLVRQFQRKDLYHLYKHKRRIAPELLSPQEERLSRRRGILHRLHAFLGKPYRIIRRAFLARQYRRGKLVSPSAQLEKRIQPEKDSWRK